MKVLVTGGAGYIGSHACKELKNNGFTPVVVDNFEMGHQWAVRWGPVHQCDVRDTAKLTEIMKAEKIDAVMHFAAHAYVGESVADPLKYYDNNVGGTVSVLKAMKAASVKKIVFSSSCTTYGIPKEVPISEDFPKKPESPYGQSKLNSEFVLQDVSRAHGFSCISLRYFNASGADPDLEIGEDHDPETHVVPLALQAAYKQTQFTILGSDYPTPDGTCIRDYIHVSDLASAHVLALKNLSVAGFEVFNLGTGVGHSVRKIIETVEKITGRKVPAVEGPRRPGDPPALVASPKKANEVLKWQPRHSDLEQIVGTAAKWYEKHFLRNK